MENPEYTIKIELELCPAIAMFVAAALLDYINGDQKLHKDVTETGKKYLFDIGQDITNQVAKKTVFEKLKQNLETQE